MLRETLELVPFGKLLFSSDAYGLAELYLLGALLFRRSMATVLGELVAPGDATGGRRGVRRSAGRPRERTAGLRPVTGPATDQLASRWRAAVQALLPDAVELRHELHA